MKTVTIGGETIEITDRNKNEYEAFIAASKKRDAWPQKGVAYCYIDETGQTCTTTWDSSVDLQYIEYGNCYRTEAEALAVVEKRKAQARIDAYIRENGLEFVPDWENDVQSKFGVRYNHTAKSSMVHQMLDLQCPSPFYAATEADANAIIAACEADLKIVLGVK